MLSDETSSRLNLLRFPLIVGVVFIHNYETTVDFQGSAAGIVQSSVMLDFVRNLISQGIARTAVPLFFLMSGYLFFYGFDMTKAGYVAKLKSRSKTLLFPFIFWNIATLAIVAAAQAIPAAAVYFSGKHALVAGFGIADYFSPIFGIGRLPISYQFWFIRDLMMLVLLTPLIFVMCKKMSIPFLLTLFAMWLSQLWPLPVPSVEATLFFSTGCWLAISKRDVFLFDGWGLPIAVTYTGFAILDAAGSLENLLGNGIHKIAILLGVITALCLTKVAVRSQYIAQQLLYLSSTSFLVYAMHEPLLTICRKMIYRTLQPQTPALVLGLYFAIPSLVIMFILLLRPILQTVFPRFVSAVSGGR